MSEIPLYAPGGWVLQLPGRVGGSVLSTADSTVSSFECARCGDSCGKGQSMPILSSHLRLVGSTWYPPCGVGRLGRHRGMLSLEFE